MKIRAFAASDRNNYGDLIFPLVIKKYFEKNAEYFEFLNYGIIKSDLSYFGALPTKSFNQLINSVRRDKEKSIIIIAGGEVLGSNWLNIYRFINTFFNKLYHNKYTSSFLKKTNLLERLNLKRFGSSVPFILDGKYFSNSKIIYSSVGALAIEELLKKDGYISYFKNVNILSVRDNVSHSFFKNAGISASLIPDSALLMSDLFSNELQSVSDKCKSVGSKKYLFLQLGNTKGPDDLDLFVENLKKFSKKHSLEIVLCPIGLALDHSDNILLKKIVEEYPNVFKYYEPQTIFEIMYLLKNASLYLGTSLHGFITSQSFNVPFFIFPQKIQKLKFYIDTWFDNAAEKYGEFEDFYKVERLYLNYNFELEKQNTDKHKELIKKNLSSFIL